MPNENDEQTTTTESKQKHRCPHLYFRVIVECMKCGQQITNVNSVRYKIPGSTENYIFHDYKPYRFDSCFRKEKLTD